MPLLIFFTLFFHSAAGAGCLTATAPHTLEPAMVRSMAEIHAFLDHEEDGPSCEQDLAAKREGVETWLGFFRQNIEETGMQETKWVEGLLKRTLPTGADTQAACALDEELAEAEKFYELFSRRAEAIDERLNSVAHTLLLARAEQAVFDNLEMARKLLDCRDELLINSVDWDFPVQDENYAAEERQTCLGRTGADPELWESVKLLSAHPAGVATGLYCQLDESQRGQARENLALATGIEKGAEKVLRDSIKYIETAQEAAPGLIGRIREKRKPLRTRRCETRRQGETLKVESRMRKLFAEEGWGSGFVLEGPKGKPELVTARHVVFEGESQESGRVKTVGVKAEKQPRHGVRFPTSPGFYDRGRDLIKRPHDKPTPAFAALDQEEILPPGEKVTLHGYPASRDGKFTTFHCEVKGIGRNIFDTANAESYLVHCPGAEAHIAGMSGGPVLNENGKVVGAVTAHNPLTNIVIVQRIARNAQGENEFGFRKIFLYDACFDEADTTLPRRCQIIPGLTYQESIP